MYRSRLDTGRPQAVRARDTRAGNVDAFVRSATRLAMHRIVLRPLAWSCGPIQDQNAAIDGATAAAVRFRTQPLAARL